MTAQPPRSLGDALRDALPTYEAPDRLHAFARAQASSSTVTADRFTKSHGMRRFAYAAALILAVAVGGVAERVRNKVSESTSERNVLVADLVDTHVRSLMANHLTDVLSSDHHTVKPWFAGKITFAPYVPELQPQGFPLVGGRVEFVNGRTAAALVYGRGLHTINLFIWPAAPSDEGNRSATHGGYSLVHWTARGLSYWAVSDAAPAELDAFEKAFTSATP
jgi:anti-sigma factor RsiW